MFCGAAEDGPRGSCDSAAGGAVRTGAVRESVRPLSDVEEAPGRVSARLLLLRCCALPATAAVTVWEVEFSQTRRPAGNLMC